MSKKTIQTVGTVTKEEKLTRVESETFTNILLLESQLPYPGYHGLTVPDKLEPDSVFAITKLMYNDERIIRCIQRVKQNLSVKFDAAPGTLNLQNKDVHFIRFKDLPYRSVGDVLDEFQKCGINFKKSRKVAPFTTIIKVRKFFRLDEIEDGIFADTDDKHMAYLLIPVQLRWGTFKKITTDIRYNVQDPHYDAAQTSIYGEQGLLDFVRMWDKNSSVEKLRYLRKKYLEAIEKL
jgi:hypothetical protein